MPIAPIRHLGLGLASLLAVAYSMWMLVAAFSWVGQPYPGFLAFRTGHVSTISRSSWNGSQAGLKTSDHVVAVDGRPITTGREIFLAAASRPAGTPVVYDVERYGAGGAIQPLKFTVPTGVLTRADVVATAMPLWIMGTVSIWLGIVVSFLRPDDPAARAHFAFCMAAGGLFLSVFNVSTDFTLNGLPIDLAGGCVAVTAVRLALTTPRRPAWLDARPRLARSLGVVAALYVAAIVGIDQALNLGYFAHLISASMNVLAYGVIIAVALWARRSPDSTATERSQGTIILVGATLGLVPGAVTHILKLLRFPLIGGEFTDLAFLLFPAAIAYAVVRHGLFQVHVFIKRTLTYATVTVILTAAYFLLAATATALLGQQTALMNVVVTAVIAISFAPLRDLTKRRVDRAFFRRAYNFEHEVTRFGDAIRELRVPAPLFAALLAHATDALHPSSMAVLLFDESGESLVPVAIDGVPVPISPAQLRAHWADARVTGPFVAADRSGTLVFPLAASGVQLGFVVVGRQKSDRDYREADVRLLGNLVDAVAGAYQAIRSRAQLTERAAELDRMNQELAIATRIQTALVPAFVRLDGFDAAVEMRPASEVGGDLIDYVAGEDGRFWLAVGDVTGHGLTPGLVMMMAQSMFTCLAREDAAMAPAAMLAAINRALYENVRHRLNHDACMTLQLVRHDGEGRFEAAGFHCDILVRRAATGLVERIETPGVWTGLLPDHAEFTQTRTFTLEVGDVLVLHTDGLIEASDASGAQYDVQRLEALIAAEGHLPAEALKGRILDAVQRWLAVQRDDITLLVLKRGAPGW